MQKYRLLDTDQECNGQKLYRLEALKEFYSAGYKRVRVGYLGGFVSGEHNLSQEGNCWIGDQAQVLGNARVFDDAFVGGKAKLCDNVQVFGNAEVHAGLLYHDVKIFDNAVIESIYCDDMTIGNAVQIYGRSRINSVINIGGATHIWGNSVINAQVIRGNIKIYDAEISGNICIRDEVEIIGPHIDIEGDFVFSEQAKITNSNSINGLYIRGLGRIGGTAEIQSSRDFLQSKIHSDFAETLTAYKTKAGFEIRYNDRAFSAQQIRQALNAYSEYEMAVNVAQGILGFSRERNEMEQDDEMSISEYADMGEGIMMKGGEDVVTFSNIGTAAFLMTEDTLEKGDVMFFRVGDQIQVRMGQRHYDSPEQFLQHTKLFCQHLQAILEMAEARFG